MGFLEAGIPMEWQDTKEYHEILEYVLKHGADQFLEVYRRVKDRKNDVLKWGDEVEFHIFKLNEKEESAAISLKARDLIQKLSEEDELLKKKGDTIYSIWHPEYGAWMIEAPPNKPYGNSATDLRTVEPNLRNRRKRILDALGEDEGVIGLVAWPRLGCEGFLAQPAPTGGPVSKSLFLPDSLINPHPRFGTLTRNIRKRRGKKVDIDVPLYIDENTNVEKLPKYSVVSKCNLTKSERKEIYMDSMGFGMGCCCLQVTFQARDIVESRHLYDQLAVLCPIFLALTAGTPILKGLLADTDVRWSTISQSVDCRTPVENGCVETSTTLEGAEVPQRGRMKIRKSRYDSIDSYISTSPLLKPEYNDNETEIDEPTLKKLLDNGVDEVLARHIAHLFIRDPLVIFSDRVKVRDDSTTEHFENIQSTNWQTMRWKPPPMESNMGWRVEFRPMEMQLTDFENAAYTVMIVLITRVILFFDLNLYIPISKVDENMKTAHMRDAVTKQKFYFRKDLVPLESQCGPVSEEKLPDVESEYELMTIEEILVGKGEAFPGLVPLILAYLEIIECDDETAQMIEDYIDFVVDRAKGDVLTTAKWIRGFVDSHPEYKKDSVISKKIEYDLVKRCLDISNGKVHDSTLLGNNRVCPMNENGSGEVGGKKMFPRSCDLEEEVKTKDFKRLRGSSFQEDVGMSPAAAFKCAVVKSLIAKYKDGSKRQHVLKESLGFANTPAFLSTK
mmetsp:Transcript_12081/g.15670  ORF Transcript_12081/g.15670 Transcript_12081/m.15670 type:complete len:729 (+) Transcript_12081:98-2284(+)